MAKPTTTEIERRLTPLERDCGRYRAAFMRSAGIGLIASPEDGRIIDVNEVLAEATGYDRDELIGRVTTDLGLW